MTIRAVKGGDAVDDEALSEYIFKILSVPAFVYHVNSMCPEVRVIHVKYICEVIILCQLNLTVCYPLFFNRV